MNAKLKNKIILRIKELEEFINDSAASLSIAPHLSSSEWYLVDDDMFEKYNIDEDLVSDKYYFGECVNGILFELRNLLKDDSLNTKTLICCERCSNDFPKDEIELHDGELLCEKCLDEVEDENGYAHDLRW